MSSPRFVHLDPRDVLGPGDCGIKSAPTRQAAFITAPSMTMPAVTTSKAPPAACAAARRWSNAIRRQVEGRCAIPNIPPKANRKWKNCFSPFLYRARNAIERMFRLERLQASGDAL